MDNEHLHPSQPQRNLLLYHLVFPASARGAIPPSLRAYPARLPALEYSGHVVVKRVTNAGTIRFQDRRLFLANALKQHHIGLDESDDGL
jgi:hypothetical protein